MSKPLGTHEPSATAGPGRGAPRENLAGIPPPGTYLTDGVFLYRVLDAVAVGGEEAVELEDCYRLDIARVAASELQRRRLRVVVPEPA